MNERELLVTAFCIGEWASALDHLNALMVVGERVPFSVIGRLQSELSDMCERWTQLHGDARMLTAADREIVVVEARTYCTEHGIELANLRDELESR